MTAKVMNRPETPGYKAAFAAHLAKPKAAGGFDFPTQLVGNSTWIGSDGGGITVYYDPSTGAEGLAAAKYVLDGIDNLMEYCDTIFGVKGKSGNVIVAAVGGATDGTGGAYHYGCSFNADSPGSDWYEDVSSDVRLTFGLVMAEVCESYMGLQAKGWNCILPDQEIQGRIIGGSKARYSGQAVEVTTASGKSLTVTANHPVLTMQGFIPACQLNEGQDLLNYIGENESVSSVNYEQHAPTIAEDVFCSLQNVTGSILATEKASSVPLDFHGDAAFFKGQIEIVGSYRQLRDDSVADTTESFVKNDLLRSDAKHSQMTSGRTLHVGFDGAFSSTDSDMGGIGLLEPSIGIHGSPDTLSGIGESLADFRVGHGFAGSVGDSLPYSGRIHNKVHSFGSASHLDIPLAEFKNQRLAASVVLASQLTKRCSGQIVTDKIVNIRTLHYEGPVYDFESPLGWIVANGLCVSNCGGSGGEGLSRFLAEIVSDGPNGSLGAFSSGAAWDGTDWISRDQGTDQDYPSIGCSILYCWWMTSLGFTPAQIVQAGEPDGTLSTNYATLTGKPATQAFTDFKAAVQAVGGPGGFQGDNPFNAPTPPYPLSGGAQGNPQHHHHHHKPRR